MEYLKTFFKEKLNLSEEDTDNFFRELDYYIDEKIRYRIEEHEHVYDHVGNPFALD